MNKLRISVKTIGKNHRNSGAEKYNWIADLKNYLERLNSKLDQADEKNQWTWRQDIWNRWDSREKKKKEWRKVNNT